MSVVSVNRDPTPRQLNQFGFIWLGFLTFFGAVLWFKVDSNTAAIVLWVGAIVIPVIGWLVPAVMRAVFLGMSYAAWPIGYVVSHVVLAIVYYLVMTPIGLAMRLFGYDPMTRRGQLDGTSAWVERADGGRQPHSYFRQF